MPMTIGLPWSSELSDLVLTIIGIAMSSSNTTFFTSLIKSNSEIQDITTGQRQMSEIIVISHL